MASDESQGAKAGDKGDLRSMLRSLIAPVIEQVETRVSTQIDDEVAAKVDELLATRMTTVDRAIGDLDRHLAEITARLDRLERLLGTLEERLDEEGSSPALTQGDAEDETRGQDD